MSKSSFNVLKGCLFKTITKDSCPRFGRIACGIVTSALLTMLALMQTPGDKFSGLVAMGVRYVQLLVEKCWRERSVLLLLSLGAFSR